MVKNVYRSACKVPVIVVRSFDTQIFSTDFFEKYPNIKIRTVVAQQFYMDRRTDVTNLRVAFRNFVESNLKTNKQTNITLKLLTD